MHIASYSSQLMKELREKLHYIEAKNIPTKYSIRAQIIIRPLNYLCTNIAPMLLFKLSHLLQGGGIRRNLTYLDV